MPPTSVLRLLSSALTDSISIFLNLCVMKSFWVSQVTRVVAVGDTTRDSIGAAKKGVARQCMLESKKATFDNILP